EIIAVCNFVPVCREDYKIGVPYAGSYEEVLSTDDSDFGGKGVFNKKIKSIDEGMHGYEQCISLTIPPLSVMFLKHIPKLEKAPKTKANDISSKFDKKSKGAKTVAQQKALRAAKNAENRE
ncbi:MAG: alpha amylase C-terminal domain-containing protein, partial [Oscillospiraceae bacterium]